MSISPILPQQKIGLILGQENWANFDSTPNWANFGLLSLISYIIIISFTIYYQLFTRLPSYYYYYKNILVLGQQASASQMLATSAPRVLWMCSVVEVPVGQRRPTPSNSTLGSQSSKPAARNSWLICNKHW